MKDLGASPCSTCWWLTGTALLCGSAPLARWGRAHQMGPTLIQKQTGTSTPTSLHPGAQSKPILTIPLLPAVVSQDRACDLKLWPARPRASLREPLGSTQEETASLLPPVTVPALCSCSGPEGRVRGGQRLAPAMLPSHRPTLPRGHLQPSGFGR